MRNVKLLLVIFLFLATESGCKHSLNLRNKYQLDYRGWKSEIILRDDDSFDQVANYLGGKSYRVSGKWKRSANAVDFYPFLYLVDMEKSSWNSTASEVFSARALIVPERLVFREVSGFVYTAVK